MTYEDAKAEIQAIYDSHESEWDLLAKIEDWLGVKRESFAGVVQQIKVSVAEIVASQTKE
jgi:hypothetical protein